MNPYLYAAPVLFLVAFAGLWSLITYGLSYLGWRTLARTYEVARVPDGIRYNGQSGYVNVCNYRQVLNVTLGPQGVGVSVMCLFRLGHPPLLLPWATVVSAREEKVLFYQYLNLQLTASGTRFRLYLPLSAREQVAMFAPASLANKG